jgi:hypothetical protein
MQEAQMKREHADHRSRTGITPPTKTEFALAKSRGVVLTGGLLAQMRTEARAAKVRSSVQPETPKPLAPSNPKTIKILLRQIEKLRSENTLLKVKIMTSK